MISIEYHAHFIKSARKLPKVQKKKLSECLTHLQINPYSPQLHTKHLSTPLTGLLSFRITREWRVIFRFLNEDTILLVEVAHRKDIYR
jgi:mRNA-degrading endonuclease RelE of RelBE toxin-antitoxin system